MTLGDLLLLGLGVGAGVLVAKKRAADAASANAQAAVTSTAAPTLASSGSDPIITTTQSGQPATIVNNYYLDDGDSVDWGPNVFAYGVDPWGGWSSFGRGRRGGRRGGGGGGRRGGHHR